MQMHLWSPFEVQMSNVLLEDAPTLLFLVYRGMVPRLVCRRLGAYLQMRTHLHLLPHFG